MSPGPELPNRSDMVIVGGGIMGTSTAFFLSRETELEITLIEKNAIASGSTGDSSAILRHHYGDQAIYSRMAWWSHQFYRRFEQETGQPLAYAESPLVRFGKENTPEAGYFRDGYDILRELGIPVSECSGEELPRRYPMYRGLDEFDFAISDDEAAYSDGTDAANGFARAARDRGVRIVRNVAVRAIREQGGRVTGVSTTHGELDSERVVVAAGPWTPRLARTVGLDIPITPVREQILILEPPEEYVEAYPSLTPTTSLPGGRWYVRPDFGDGVLVATHRHSEATDPDHYKESPDQQIILELTEHVEERLPGLRNARIKGKYCGVYSTTPDHDFIIDQVGPEGLFFCCGFSGHGFKHGPAVGQITSDLITSGTTDIGDLDYFSLNRFERDAGGHGLPEDYI